MPRQAAASQEAGWLSLFRWEVSTNANARYLQDPDHQLLSIADDIDNGPRFNWRVFGVTASGFFTDSYNLFASNVILPALAFLYWSPHSTTNDTSVNAVTLAGSVVGQIVFGFLADKYGRQRLYGIELIIVIFSTIGVAQSAVGIYDASGIHHSMSVIQWLLAWRFVMGVGIGAEYPLSACIAAEWSPRKSRGLMMSSVFIMQPLGQMISYILGIGVLHALDKDGAISQSGPETRYLIDIYWRIITGVGGIVALVAIIFRFALPETGRYTYGVKGSARKAKLDTEKGLRQMRSDVDRLLRKWFPRRASKPEAHELQPLRMGNGHVEEPQNLTDGGHIRDLSQDQRTATEYSLPEFDQQQHATAVNDADVSLQAPRQRMTTEYSLPDNDSPTAAAAAKADQFTLGKVYVYFIDGGNWRRLAGTSLCWFLLDFAFFGLSLNGSGTLARLWTTGDRPTNVPSWLINSKVGNRDTTCSPPFFDCSEYIYDVLSSNCMESLVSVCIGSVLGSVLMLFVVDRVDRRWMIIVMFVVLSAVLMGLWVAFHFLFHKDGNTLLVFLYGLAQFGFAFGPNTLTFIIPAEAFPTEYRCTAHGISAAAGKLGSIMAQVAYITWPNGRDANDQSWGYLIILYAAMCFLGAVFAWAWLPSVQEGHPRQGKKLEDLGRGRQSLPKEERVGFRSRWAVTRLWWSGGKSRGSESEEIGSAQ